MEVTVTTHSGKMGKKRKENQKKKKDPGRNFDIETESLDGFTERNVTGHNSSTTIIPGAVQADEARFRISRILKSRCDDSEIMRPAWSVAEDICRIATNTLLPPQTNSAPNPGFLVP
jgi:hypothetical protein